MTPYDKRIDHPTWVQDVGTKSWYLVPTRCGCPYTSGVLKETRSSLFRRVGYGAWSRIPKRLPDRIG